MILRSSDGEDGGAAQHATEHNIDILSGAGEGQTENNVAGTGAEGVQNTPPASTGITEEALTRILQEVIPAAAAPVQQQPPPRQLTQEEFNQKFNVWTPSADLATRLKSDDPAIQQKAFIEMRDGMIKQASTIAEARIQQVIEATNKAVDDRLTPLQAFYQEQQNQALEAEFFTTNKDLKPYAEIVDAVSAKVCGDGVKRTKKEVFESVASASRAVVKKMLAAGGVTTVDNNGNGNGNGNGNNGAQRPASNGKQMAALSGGGQQGGRGGGNAPARKPGMAIFDETD